MAKMTAHGTHAVTSWTNHHGTKYTLRSDGTVLRQLRIFGKLESPTVYARDISAPAFERFVDRMVAAEEMS